MNMAELPPVDCQTTKQNKIIITCKNKFDLEQVKDKIRTTEDMAEKLDIKEPNPKTARVIVFGAPEAPVVTRKNVEREADSSQDNLEEQQELYEKQVLYPALERALRKKVQYKLIRVLKGRQGEETSHLVLQLLERDALQLMAGKLCIGFNRCTVRRYVFIQRCFNCQEIGHTARGCQNAEACAKCGKGHNIKDCTSKNEECVNCKKVLDYYKGDHRRAGLYEKHPSYDPSCSVYLRKKQEALASLSYRGDSRCPSYKQAQRTAAQQRNQRPSF